MAANGFPIAFEQTSGQGPGYRAERPVMSSTVIKSLCTSVLFAALGTSAVAAESNHRPQFVQDPVLGLRLRVASISLDTVPEEIRALCTGIADSSSWTGRQWIFGVAKYRAVTYYLASGYYKRRHPQSGELLYFQPDGGGIYRVSEGKCNGDPARETFDVRDPKQIPREVLQQLASDLAMRLVRAAGGPDRLRAELTNQHVDFLMLSPEMQEAFRPYFAPAD